MNHTLVYDVRARVTFEPEELKHLIAQSQQHYDRTCRMASEPAASQAKEFGFAAANGFLIIASLMGGTVQLTAREVDTACKILELPESDQALAWKLHQLVTAMNDETKRLNSEVRR